MKNKITSLLVAVLMLAVMSSCKDDSENEIIDDNTAPLIAFTSHEADADVWNTITIKTEVTEENALEKVEFYVGGTLVEEVKTAPFNMTLNTKNYEDGAVEIKAVASDKVGNESEKTLSLNIENTLLSFSVPGNYLAEDFYVFLSDSDGNLIESKKIEDTSPVIFLRPDGFEAEYFSLSTFDKGAGSYGHVDTYTDIIYGSDLGLKGVATSSSKGTANVQIDDLSHSYGATITAFSGHSVQIYSSCSPCSYDVELYTSPTDIYITNEPQAGDPSYTFIQDVAVDDQVTVEVSAFSPMTSQQVSIPSDFENGFMLLSGLFKRENLPDGILMINFKSWNDLSSSTEFFYPEDVFDGLETLYSLTKGSKTYTYRAISDIVSPFEASTVDIKVSDKTKRTMAATIIGDYDLFISSWAFTEEGYTISHRVSGKAGIDIEVVRPQLPEEILIAHPFLEEEKFEPASMTARDYLDVEGYSDYIDYALNANAPHSNILAAEKSVSENLKFSSEGGRFLKNEIDIDRLLLER